MAVVRNEQSWWQKIMILQGWSGNLFFCRAPAARADREVNRRPGGPPHKHQTHGHSHEKHCMSASGTAR